MDLREVFAGNLRRLRHAKGLSQDDLAYEAEVSRSYLSQLEKGAFYASLKIVGKLAAVLDVEPAELLKLPLGKRSPPQMKSRSRIPGR
jgi:transcriptional regulator with XRE-family HTH domain